jgi:hypothetical protein
MNTKAATALALVWLAAPLAQAMEPPAQEAVVSSTQIPSPALKTLDAKAGKNRIHQFTKRTFPSGAATYTVRYHTLTTGDTEVEVTPKGNVVGEYRRLEEPEGTGP